MRTIIKREKTHITTGDGQRLVRRITTVLRPNGTYRYPVDYYDATPGVIRVTQKEKDLLKVPGYKQLFK